MPPTILSPTRGGRASYPNQDRAIAIAKERGESLLFLYVSNVQFLGLTAMPIVVDLETEIDEMGEFLLAMAQERAEKAGVHAEATVRRGVFRNVIKDVIQEYTIQTVVLGYSGEGQGLLTADYIRELGREVSRETGVEFIVVHDGQVVQTYPPATEQTAE